MNIFRMGVVDEGVQNHCCTICTYTVMNCILHCIFIFLLLSFSGEETGDTFSGRSPATKDMAPPARRPAPPHHLSPPQVAHAYFLPSHPFSPSLHSSRLYIAPPPCPFLYNVVSYRIFSVRWLFKAQPARRLVNRHV